MTIEGDSYSFMVNHFTLRYDFVALYLLNKSRAALCDKLFL